MTPMSTPANNQGQSDHRLSRRKPPNSGVQKHAAGPLTVVGH